MKKKISYFLACLFVALSLIIPTFADEATTDVVTEVVTDVVAEAVTSPTADSSDTAIPDAMTEEDVEGYWDEFKDKITDSATWTMIGAAIVTVLSTIATIKSGLEKFRVLVHSKADAETVQASLKEIENELKTNFNESYAKIESTLERYENALKNTDDNEQKIYAILAVFMTNCKISETAKAEILGILTDVKKYEGTVSEIVAKAQEAIENAKAENAKLAEPTPTLDKMLDEEFSRQG